MEDREKGERERESTVGISRREVQAREAAATPHSRAPPRSAEHSGTKCSAAAPPSGTRRQKPSLFGGLGQVRGERASFPRGGRGAKTRETSE